MIDQSREAIATEVIEEIEVTKKEYGLISIANGDGFEEIFKSIGVDVIVKGGQSMNPSTYDIVKAINTLDSEKIILLPNNKNIILTANQAKKIVKKDITVIPTITIPQGISAVLIFNPDLSLEENIDNMQKSISSIKTGEITKAVRDANIFVGQIKKGEYIGLRNGKVKVISDNLIDAVFDLVRDLIAENNEVITFYYGEGTTAEDNKNIENKLKSLYPKIEIEFHKGGQPLYPYIFSIE
jgi:dihydroxyacetone kinase-like predicted kinase